jgi:hypothetical protein
MFLSGLGLKTRRSGASRRRGRPRAELLQEGEEIGHAPVLGNLAAAYAHDIDGLEVNRAAGRVSALRERWNEPPICGTGA